MRKWLITAAVLIGVGILVALVGAAMAGFDFKELSTQKMEKNTFTVEEAFSDIGVDVTTADITFLPASDGKVTVVCFENSKVKHTVQVRDGKLMITEQDNRKWYDRIGIQFYMSKLTVYLPAGNYGALELKCTTGDVNMPDDFTFLSASLNRTTGDTLWRAPVQQKFFLKCSTGDVELIDMTCKELEIKGTTNDVELIRVNVAQRMSISITTGDVDLEYADAGEIDIKTTTGDVEGTLLSGKLFYVDTTTGDVRVPESAAGGKCEIKTTTGDIEIRIAK